MAYFDLILLATAGRDMNRRGSRFLDHERTCLPAHRRSHLAYRILEVRISALRQESQAGDDIVRASDRMQLLQRRRRDQHPHNVPESISLPDAGLQRFHSSHLSAG